MSHQRIGSLLTTLLHDARKVLALGMGGGGDVVGALASAKLAESFACEFTVGGTLWERLPSDPEPGPRSLDEVVNAERLNRVVSLAGPETRSKAGVIFSESRMARFLGDKTMLVDIRRGPAELAAGIADAARELGYDLALFVDVGGDMLANGPETGLASPLCDAIMLATAARLQDEVNCVAAVFGPGCDGELTQEEVLDHTAEIAREGGWLGAWGLTPDITSLLEQAIRDIPTEVSAQTVRCARGETGLVTIRQGNRKVHLSPLGAMTLYFDPQIAVRTVARIAREVDSCGSLDEANERLHKLGLRTELDYERMRTER